MLSDDLFHVERSYALPESRTQNERSCNCVRDYYLFSLLFYLLVSRSIILIVDVCHHCPHITHHTSLICLSCACAIIFLAIGFSEPTIVSVVIQVSMVRFRFLIACRMLVCTNVSSALPFILAAPLMPRISYLSCFPLIVKIPLPLINLLNISTLARSDKPHSQPDYLLQLLSKLSLLTKFLFLLPTVINGLIFKNFFSLQQIFCNKL